MSKLGSTARAWDHLVRSSLLLAAALLLGAVPLRAESVGRLAGIEDRHGNAGCCCSLDVT